jgi:hypothetical protein
MNDFLNNISRYPRFFISSVIGLILVILTPIRNLLKIKKLQAIVPIFIVTFIAFLYIVLKNMLAL